MAKGLNRLVNTTRGSISGVRDTTQDFRSASWADIAHMVFGVRCRFGGGGGYPYHYRRLTLEGAACSFLRLLQAEQLIP